MAFALPPELLWLLPLSLAAGLDLYLTLLILGAAPATGLWTAQLPGATGDLSSFGVMVMAGGFYLLEFVAERFHAAGLFWNTFHAIIRPLAGCLLALLILEGQPLPIVIAGAVTSGCIASATHAVRSGAAVTRWLTSRPSPKPLLVSLAEDAVVIGIVALALDRTTGAAWISLALIAVMAIRGPSSIRAFLFAIYLATHRILGTLKARRWLPSEDFPGWVRRALAGDVMAPGGGLRGSPVAVAGLTGPGHFTVGWIVVRGDSPVYLHRRLLRIRHHRLDSVSATSVTEAGFFRRLDFTRPNGSVGSIFFGLDGPSSEGLEAEFLIGAPR